MSSSNQKNIKDTILIYLFIFIVSILIGDISFRLYKSKMVEESDKNIINLTINLGQLIQERIYSSISVLNSMETLLIESNYDVESFHSWKEGIYRSNSSLSCIQIAPDGVIQYVYPKEGNEAVLGLNLLEDKKRQKGAFKAIESGEATMIGPVTLIQNGLQSIIVREPIYKESKFWGFAIILLEIDKLIPEQIQQLELDKLSYQILGHNPDAEEEPVVVENIISDDVEWVMSHNIKTPNGIWNLQVGKVSEPFTSYIMVYLIFVSISFLFGFVIMVQHHNIVKRENQFSELEKRYSMLAMGATANHEINQPLATIRGYLDIMKLQCKLPDEKTEKYYNEIDKAFAEINAILEKLSSFESYNTKEYVNDISILELKSEEDRG